MTVGPHKYTQAKFHINLCHVSVFTYTGMQMNTSVRQILLNVLIKSDNTGWCSLQSAGDKWWWTWSGLIEAEFITNLIIAVILHQLIIKAKGWIFVCLGLNGRIVCVCQRAVLWQTVPPSVDMRNNTVLCVCVCACTQSLWGEGASVFQRHWLAASLPPEGKWGSLLLWICFILCSLRISCLEAYKSGFHDEAN